MEEGFEEVEEEGFEEVEEEGFEEVEEEGFEELEEEGFAEEVEDEKEESVMIMCPLTAAMGLKAAFLLAKHKTIILSGEE